MYTQQKSETCSEVTQSNICMKLFPDTEVVDSVTEDRCSSLDSNRPHPSVVSDPADLDVATSSLCESVDDCIRMDDVVNTLFIHLFCLKITWQLLQHWCSYSCVCSLITIRSVEVEVSKSIYIRRLKSRVTRSRSLILDKQKRLQLSSELAETVR